MDELLAVRAGYFASGGRRRDESRSGGSSGGSLSVGPLERRQSPNFGLRTRTTGRIDGQRKFQQWISAVPESVVRKRFNA